MASDSSASAGKTLETRVTLLTPAPLGEEEWPTEPVAEGDIAVEFLRNHALLPLAWQDDLLILAAPQPLPLSAIDALRQKIGRSIGLRIASREAILEKLSDARLAAIDLDDAESRLAGGIDDAEQDIETLRALAEDAPIVKLAQDLLTEAVKARASDLHLEIFQDQFRVRMRVDGLLLDRPSPPRRAYLPLVSHLKLRAQMNIAERRLPQDGRIKLAHGGRQIDCRVSTIPTVHGESMAIRLLDSEFSLIGLDRLGLSEGAQRTLEASIRLPHGMLLVTGPTGSGKTTSLYAMLGALNQGGNKIITVEDPVEYQIAGINQIQVKPMIDLTFANALRAIVRQDPDVLMVGEIRDRDTAEIAIQSSLTGHLVLSTLHTNDAVSAPHRLLDMGVEPYLIASSVVLILAQRLVRTLCPHCRRSHPVTEADRLFLASHGLATDCGELAAAAGCAQCRGTGYLGRTGIFEILPVSDAVKEAILRKEPARVLRRIAQAEHQDSLHADGLHKVLAGVTTLEELARVARSDRVEADAAPP